MNMEEEKLTKIKKIKINNNKVTVYQKPEEYTKNEVAFAGLF